MLFSYVFLCVNMLWSTLAILRCVLPRKLYANVSKRLVKWFLILFVWAYERNAGYRTVLTGDLDGLRRESAMIIANHPGQDWAPLYSFALSNDMLGHVLPIVKKSLQWIPGFGWAMYLAGVIFLSRKFKQDKMYIETMMKCLREDDVPFHIWLFAEGHRFTKKGYEAGVQFAKSRGIVPYKHVLVPRTKGFTVLRRSLDCKYIFDVTIAYSGMKPTVSDILLPDGSSRERGPHVHVKKVLLADVPNSDTGMDAFLKDLYRKKDKLLAHFHAHGRFPHGNGKGKMKVLRNVNFQDCIPAIATYGCIASLWVAVGICLIT